MFQLDDLSFSFDEFEGPLTLLLELVKKQEVRIQEFSLTRLTNDYRAKLESFDEQNILVSAEFMSMLAYLLRLKSELLLPSVTEEEKDSKKQELVDLLLDVEAQKEQAAHMQLLKQLEDKLHKREEKEKIIRKRDHRFDELLSSYNDLLHRLPKSRDAKRLDPFAELLAATSGITFHMEDQMVVIKDILSEEKELLVDHFFGRFNYHEELVETFSALLELIKTGEVTLIWSDDRIAIAKGETKIDN